MTIRSLILTIFAYQTVFLSGAAHAQSMPPSQAAPLEKFERLLKKGSNHLKVMHYFVGGSVAMTSGEDSAIWHFGSVEPVGLKVPSD